MAETKVTRIYVMRDPRDGSVRYVGKTIRTLKTRLSQHIRTARGGALDTRVARWIRSLLSVGFEPAIEQIDTALQDWAEREIYWIAYYRKQGADLVNHTDGGEGTLGKKLSERQKAMVREASKRRWADPEFRERAVAGIIASCTPELSARRSKSGVKSWTPERRAAEAVKMRERRAREVGDAALLNVMTEAARAAWQNPEHKAARIEKMKAIWTPERRAAQAEKLRQRMIKYTSERQAKQLTFLNDMTETG